MYESAEIIPGGTLATVYHRTQSYESIQKIFQDGYEIGNGVMYGAGLYTCYELNSQFTEYMERYGPYLVKFVINTETMLNFDKLAKMPLDTRRKVFELLTAKVLGKSMLSQDPLFIDDLLQDCPKDNGTTSSAALHFVSRAGKEIKYFLKVGINGLIFTGSNDGKVAVIFTPKIAIPVSYADASVQDYADNPAAIIWKKLDNKSRIINKYVPEQPDHTKYFMHIYKKALTPISDNNANGRLVYNFDINILKKSPNIIGDLRDYITPSTNSSNAQLVIVTKQDYSFYNWYFFNKKYGTTLCGKFNQTFKVDETVAEYSSYALGDLVSLLPGIRLSRLFFIEHTMYPEEAEKVLKYYKPLYTRLLVRFLKNAETNLDSFTKKAKEEIAYLYDMDLDSYGLKVYFEHAFKEYFKSPLITRLISLIEITYEVKAGRSPKGIPSIFSHVYPETVALYNQVFEKALKHANIKTSKSK